ncbi:MAG TPA: sulfite exporter TauE/SafE family protein [Pirellulaceae bacterium]|nr:sulfite exporter TauE/SafE family protein [Pirellulaceae bacterium]
MPLTISQYLLVSLILFFSSVVQGAVGFAAGLFGIPLLMLTGVSLPDAVAISLVAAAVQNVAAAWQLRREIDYRLAVRPMLIRFATLPLGVWALSLIGSEQKDLAGQLVGVVVLAIVAVQSALRIEPRERIHQAWEWLAFGMGGFLLGLCGMGGPAMVLWVMAHNWPMNRARGFLFFIFATGIPLQALLLWLAFGNPILEAMLLGLVALPSVALGLYVGLWLAHIAPDRVLRILSWAVLVLIAVSSMVMPYVT